MLCNSLFSPPSNLVQSPSLLTALCICRILLLHFWDARVKKISIGSFSLKKSVILTASSNVNCVLPFNLAFNDCTVIPNIFDNLACDTCASVIFPFNLSNDILSHPSVAYLGYLYLTTVFMISQPTYATFF